ncbi:MAG: DUF167 domain-containing protein [Nitrospirota bacterium]
MKLSITVKPKSKQEKIEKTVNGYIIYVKEQPIENKANRAVIELLSEYFGVSKSQITILSGMKSKQKIVEIKNFSESQV